MKSRTAKIVLFGILAATVAIGVALAEEAAPQGGPHHHGMRGPHGQFMGAMGMGLPMRGLNLTDDQRAQMKQIFQNEKPNIKPLMQQESQAHQQMMALVTSGSFDEAKATALATQESQIHIQMQVEHLKMASQMYQLLSADQKAKVSDMMAKHQQMMQQHQQEHGQAPPPSENQ